MKKKAEMGIGTLILFIAMISVAATAAGVLIQTTNSLQSKAFETANQAQDSVSSRLEMVNLRGSDGSDGLIEELRSQMKLAPGSESIDLESLVITLSTHNESVNLVYSNESCAIALPSGDGFYSNKTAENGTFTIDYITTSEKHSNGIISRGEMINICMATPGPIGEDISLEMNFIPKVGMPVSKEIVTGMVMVKKNVMLYP